MVSLTTRLPGYGCFESCNGNQRHKCSSVPLRMQTTWVCTPYVNLISATHCELSSLMCFIKPLIHCYTKFTSLMASLCFCMCEVLITGYKQSLWKSKHIVLFCFLLIITIPTHQYWLDQLCEFVCGVICLSGQWETGTCKKTTTTKNSDFCIQLHSPLNAPSIIMCLKRYIECTTLLSLSDMSCQLLIFITFTHPQFNSAG